MINEPITLEILKSRLSNFRSHRSSPKARIPDGIWSDIATVCKQIGVKKVSNCLNIPADRMVRKIKFFDSGKAPKLKNSKSAPKDFGVVEIGSLGKLFTASISIDFEASNNSRVRVQCSAAEILAVASFIKSLERGSTC